MGTHEALETCLHISHVLALSLLKPGDLSPRFENLFSLFSPGKPTIPLCSWCTCFLKVMRADFLIGLLHARPKFAGKLMRAHLIGVSCFTLLVQVNVNHTGDSDG